MIRSWNVKSGNLYTLGTVLFSEKEVRSMSSDARDAIRDLSEKALKTVVGSSLATLAYKKEGRLISAVAFSEEKGLCLRLNGVEHRIASAVEVYQGTVEGLKEIKKIQAAAERQGLISVEKTEGKAREVFQGFMKVRDAEIGAPTLLDRADVLKNDDRLSVQKISKIAMTWKAILLLTGLSIMKTAFENMVSSLTGRNNLEKYFLSCANFLEGLTTLGTAIVSLMKEVSTIGHHLMTKAAAGAAFPITAFILYGSVLLAAMYRLYVQLKFRSELNGIIGDGQDPAKLKEALIWLKQQTQLSHIESQESEEGMFANLRTKWEKFTLRVEEGVIDGLLSPETLDEAIAGRIDGGELIANVRKANSRAMLWSAFSILANTLGILATVAYLGCFGHFSVGAMTALYLTAAILSLLTDSPKLRLKIQRIWEETYPNLRKEFFRWLLENCNCVKSENVSVVGSDCSETSSLSYVPNEAYPSTPLRLTAETLRLLQVS